MHYLIPFRPQDVTLYYAENTIYNGNHGYSYSFQFTGGVVYKPNSSVFSRSFSQSFNFYNFKENPK